VDLLAHKFGGRAFAVNYRKVPQYPWPCPLQDVLAACKLRFFFQFICRSDDSLDLYLIQPPPEALHKPVSPSQVVFAGDSAGGGLCLTVLTILRDLGLPMPAGATLISPWVDLTHSFPSVMANYHTVITFILK
jgi:acetyl esterase/lipase